MSNLTKNVVFVVSLFIVFFSIISCVLTPSTVPVLLNPYESDNYIEMNKTGEIIQVNYSSNIVTTKDFKTLGLIFVESTAVIDSDGYIREGSKITFDMLLREAQKIGADDIINLRIDEIKNISVTEEIRRISKVIRSPNGQSQTVESDEMVKILNTTVIYKASALAIKYTDTILIPTVN